VTYGKKVQLPIKFRQCHRGRYDDRVDIMFKDYRLQQGFIISRTLHAIVGNASDHEFLKPKAPFVPRPRSRRSPASEVIPGVEPESTKAIPWVVELPIASIPQRLSSTLASGSFKETLEAIRRVHLPPSLQADTYNRHFQTLLWIEEYRMESVANFNSFCRQHSYGFFASQARLRDI
jgi:helicase MOV-10